mgnify:CR=1 FL=1
MPDRAKSIIAIVVSAVAILVIAIGLTRGPAAEPTAEDRVAALSEQIICPFCAGESLADSGSGVAADYRVLIEERVAAGYSDQEILDEFAENFGDSYVLDTSNVAGSVLLWIIPAALLAGGVVVIVSMRRSASARDEVAT